MKDRQQLIEELVEAARTNAEGNRDTLRDTIKKLSELFDESNSADQQIAAADALVRACEAVTHANAQIVQAAAIAVKASCVAGAEQEPGGDPAVYDAIGDPYHGEPIVPAPRVDHDAGDEP